MNLKEGIWVVRKIKDGDHYKYEGEKIEDVPDIMIRSSFEPYRGKIYQELYKKEDACGCVELSAKEIIALILKNLTKK